MHRLEPSTGIHPKRRKAKVDQMHDSNDVVCSKDLEQLRGQFGAALSATVKAGEVLARVNRDLHQQEDER